MSEGGTGTASEIEVSAPGVTPRGAAALPPPDSRDRLLIEGAVMPTLTMFALPLLTTNILHSLSGTWAAIWVSRTLGPEALVAVVNANIFMFMLMGAVTGVGTAAGITIGQAHGAGDSRAVKRVVGTAISFVFCFSALLALLGWIFAPNLLAAIDMPAASYDEALTFLRFTCLAIPSIFTFIFMMMMLRGRGDARTPFIFSCVWIGIAFVLVPLLITGSFGFPRLGIAGAAIANLIANGIALLALVGFVYAKDMPIALRRGDFHHFRPDLPLLWMLVKRGAPMGAEMLIVQGSYFVLLGMVNSYGAVTAAAYSAAAQLWGYVQMPAIAFGASISAMAAQNIGAGHWPRVSEIALKGVLLSMGSTGLACAALYALGDLPLLLFLPDGGEPLDIARNINEIVLWCWIVLAVTTAMFGIVRANAAMVPPTIIFFVTMWILRVPFANFLQPELGARAIWWSFPVGAIASALLAWLYYRFGGWRRNRLMIEEAEAPAEL